MSDSSKTADVLIDVIPARRNINPKAKRRADEVIFVMRPRRKTDGKAEG